MESDAEKLIGLVKSRPALYNFKLKEHNDKILTERLWMDIALAMKSSVRDCKHKWMTLRNSYARALRDEGTTTEVVARKRKPWYMQDAMSFLKLYMRQNPRNSKRSLSASLIHENFNETQHSEDNSVEKEINNFSPTFQNYSTPIDKISIPSPTHDEKVEKSIKHVKLARLAKMSKKFNRPAIKLLLSKIFEEPDDPNFMFLKSLLPDINKLSEKKQRIFKRKTIELLEELFDDNN